MEKNKMNDQHHYDDAVDMERVRREAGEWLMRAAERGRRPEDAAAFAAWLAAHPEHERVFRRQQATWGSVPDMRALDDIDDLMAPPLSERLRVLVRDGAEQMAAMLRRPAGRIAAGAMAAVSVVLIAVLTVQFLHDPGAASPMYETHVAEIRHVSLADGTVVTLGAASGMDMAFTETERRVTLLQGEAFFEVAKDPSRPFFVAAGDTVVRVVGTKFDVHHGTDQVRVSVLEGVVEVLKSGEGDADLADTNDTARVLTEGQQAISAKRGDITPIEEIAPAEIAPWRSGQLIYVDAPLKDIIADMNRYYPGDISVNDDVIRQMSFTASFRIDQIEDMVEMMAISLSLDVNKDQSGRIILMRNKSGA